ncbi:hypothetical protein AcW1_003814 [Taiwanofungus camphoratus]|nr:hypothetical protein AcW1_003814 [Antrodia cinnamomea]KAI0944091.1 hypothetical protein AcV7_002009 [Antrodia cinnamomea]
MVLLDYCAWFIVWRSLSAPCLVTRFCQLHGTEHNHIPFTRYNYILTCKQPNLPNRTLKKNRCLHACNMHSAAAT